jgi:Na+-driven multidrug efflux pump
MIRLWSRQTISIGIPALLAMMADPLLSLIDNAYVGKLGAIELAALGTCTSIFHFAFNAFRATTTATTSLVATALATSRQPTTKQTIKTTFRLTAKT